MRERNAPQTFRPLPCGLLLVRRRDLAAALAALDWMDTPPDEPVRIEEWHGRRALSPLLREADFGTYLQLENLFQGFLLTRAEACAARHLKSATPIPAACAAIVPGGLPFQEIPIAQPAALDVAEETQASAPVFTARLTLTLRCPGWTPPPGPLALRLTCADGTRLLLGTAQRPFPLMARAATHPARPAEQCAQTLTFTLTSPTPPLGIRD